MKRSVVGAAAVLGLVSGQAHAQAAQRGVHILVEKLSDSAEACNIVESALYGATTAALRYNRVRVSPSAFNNIVMYVNVNSSRSGGTCAINISVNLHKFQETPVAGVGSVWANVVFCRKTAVGIGIGGTEVTGTLKDLIDSCLADAPPAVIQAVS